PNMGAMTGCDILGSRIWFSQCGNPRRKFPETWELVEVDGGHLVCVNVHSTKQLVLEAIQNGAIQELSYYDHIDRDPELLDECSFDLMLKQQAHEDDEQNTAFVMMQSVTMGDEIHRGFFPDAMTQKGVQQLKSLIYAKQRGYRAVLVFAVLHTGIHRLFPADHIDSEYGGLIRQAVIAGVEVIGYRVDISFNAMSLTEPVEICIPARLICSSRAEKSQ
ncbi:MAG TPA: DNA/RNA nuclease SfsA, partial [Candidatus Berkiella sp.]|nr:DNA/RNA nuclease SfsA [Candidatus Berkiella sp.]